MLLSDMFADVHRIKQHDFLAKIAWMINELNDLFPWIAIDFLVVCHVQGMPGGHVLSEARHLENLVANIAEHLDGQLGIIAQSFWCLHFLRFF